MSTRPLLNNLEIMVTTPTTMKMLHYIANLVLTSLDMDSVLYSRRPAEAVAAAEPGYGYGLGYGHGYGNGYVHGGYGHHGYYGKRPADAEATAAAKPG